MAEFDVIRRAGDQSDDGIVGEVRLAMRMPPVGNPPRSLMIPYFDSERALSPSPNTHPY